MLYLAYQAHSDMIEPAKSMARTSLAMLGSWGAAADMPMLRNLSASYELVARTGLTHTRPDYGIKTVRVGNQEAEVTEVPVMKLPFGTLLNFKKDSPSPQPRVLVVAPLSGHFATLLRNTVRTLLPDHDVYITDWHNARDVSLSDGRFGFDDYVDYIIKFLEKMGPGSHLIAVCQPCVQALVATAVMSASGNKAVPHSMTLMAGPIDTRINPTKVNELASSKPIDWFENNLIARVPFRHQGAGRKVYPGFVQLSAFVSMNLKRHIDAHKELHEHLANGDIESAERIKTFYDEYFAVLDLAAEFYIETVKWVFQDALLAKGELKYKGEPVELKAIRKTALLTVEGERDDICALGQTAVAHDLCTSLRPHLKRHHMQAGVGHYGVFSGRKWEGQIYPLVRNMILAAD